MSVQTISPQEFKELLAGQPNLQLIDVRMPAEFREVHVSGARNVPYDRLLAEQFSAAPGEGEDAPVYLICQAGIRSEQACRKLRRRANVNAISVAGGTDACLAVGLPLERGKKAVSLERQVRITAGGLALAGAVLAVTVHVNWAILPAFIGAGLVYSGISNTCGMAVLLAKMPWNR